MEGMCESCFNWPEVLFGANLALLRLDFKKIPNSCNNDQGNERLGEKS